MVFYVQTYNNPDENIFNKVTDIIEYSYNDYKKVELETPLPDGAISGAYELIMLDDINGKLIYQKEWDTRKTNIDGENEIYEIKEKIESIDEIIKQNIFLSIDIDYTKPLDEVKKLAINKTKNWVSKQLDSPMEYNSKLYTITLEKQNLLSAQLGMYMMNIQAAIQMPLTWNATGEPCEDWEFEDLLMLSNAMAMHIAPLIKKQQTSEVEINNANDIEEIKSILEDFE